jgi:hypothetical protein
MMTMTRPTLLRATLLLAFAGPGMAGAEQLLTVDATAPAPDPRTGYIKLGTAVAPGGHTLGINNQYLTRDGKPWLPVMGEFHYTRSPAASWDAELAKMKSAGIDIVASYIIWNHHEANEGKFDWSGNRDLRRFVQLAHKHGLDVVVRVGPWSHAEVRYGGFPDWVVDAMPTRGNDPTYLRYVERYYREIGRQLDGLLYKQGGPVIGAQIENEYNLGGPGRGAEHIRTLKGLAVKAGIDVPYYTVTGWDQTLYPSGEVTPVFGGYPDEPWATSTKELPPKETYAFRFDTRVSGDLGAQTRASQQGTAETDMDQVPFLGAEYGAGLPAMYRRRTLVSSDDIASMLPVQLGSGVNLMGYYMFHGGRNPVASFSPSPTLEESTKSGGYNDVPAINYDFNAPLGPDGQQRDVLASLRPFHWFLHDFGARLAPMTVRKPDVVPKDPADLGPARWSVRSRGDAAFLFYDGHIRQYPTPAREQVRFAVKLPGGTVTLPRKPVDLPAGAYFAWPVNFDMDGQRLAYATAQPLAKLDDGTWVFAAQDGVPVEFAFGDKARGCVQSERAHVDAGTNAVVVDGIQPGLDAAFTLRCPGSKPLTVLVLSQTQARQAAIGAFQGQRRLVLSEAQAYFDGGRLVLRSAGQPHVRAAVYPATTLKSAGRDGLFQVFDTTLPARDVAVAVKPLRDAQPARPVRIGGNANAAVQPDPEAFGASAAWLLDVAAAGRSKDVDSLLLDIDFTGDVARLFDGTRMVDDWYYNGQRWQFDLANLQAKRQGPLTLTVLPLRADAPIYLPREHRPDFGGKAQLAELKAVKVVPVYRVEIGK